MHGTLLYDIDSHLQDMRRDLEEVAERVKDDLPRLREAVERLTLTVVRALNIFFSTPRISKGMNIAKFSQGQQSDPPVKVASMSEKTEVCISSLGFIDQTLFLSQMLNRSKGAGRWISENKKYTSWFENNKADLLW